jgi:hypothetical protein
MKAAERGRAGQMMKGAVGGEGHIVRDREKNVPSTDGSPCHLLQERIFRECPYENYELGNVQCHQDDEYSKRRILV